MALRLAAVQVVATISRAIGVDLEGEQRNSKNENNAGTDIISTEDMI